MLVLAQVSLLHVSASKTLQFAFAISAAAGIAVTILATWHGFLIATAQVRWIRIAEKIDKRVLTLVSLVDLDVRGAANQSLSTQSTSAWRKSSKPVLDWKCERQLGTRVQPEQVQGPVALAEHASSAKSANTAQKTEKC